METNNAEVVVRGERGAVATDGCMVELSKSVGAVSAVPSWEALASSQDAPTSHLLAQSRPGQVFALEDRNVESQPWRRVYVVREFEVEAFSVFDVHGFLIVEPHDGLIDGQQMVGELVSDFNNSFYRAAKVRRPPTRRHEGPQACSSNTPPVGVSSTSSEDRGMEQVHEQVKRMSNGVSADVTEEHVDDSSTPHDEGDAESLGMGLKRVV